MRFPEVTGGHLDGRPYSLPDDFEGQFNIVVLAFDRWHQALVDSWTPALDQLARHYPCVCHYKVNLHEQYWGRAVTLYTDLPAFFSELGIYMNTIYTLLLDRQGEVLWRSTGAYMPNKMTALIESLESITSRNN